MARRLTAEEQANYDRNLFNFVREEARKSCVDLNTVERPRFDSFTKGLRVTARDAQKVWDRHRGADQTGAGVDRAQKSTRHDASQTALSRAEGQSPVREAQPAEQPREWRANFADFEQWADRQALSRDERDRWKAYLIDFHAWADHVEMRREVRDEYQRRKRSEYLDQRRAEKARQQRAETLSRQRAENLVRKAADEYIRAERAAKSRQEHAASIREKEERRNAPTQNDIEWADRWRPRIFTGIALVLAVLGTGAWFLNRDDTSPADADLPSASSSPPSSSDALTAVEKRQARRAAARKAKAACLNNVQGSGATIHKCGGDSYVTCDNASSKKYSGAGQYRDTTVVCHGDNFVAVAWDSDADHPFKRVWYAGRWVGRAVSPGHGTRQARPVPKPAPTPYNPPDPEPDYSDDSSGDDLSGYTGPRCYAPGGKTWTPC